MRTLLVFLLGVLVGANAVYFTMTRGQWRPRAEPCAVASPSTAAAKAATTNHKASATAEARPPAAAGPIVGAARTPIAHAPAGDASKAPDNAPGATLAMPLATVAPQQLVDTFDDLRGTDRRHEALDIAAPAGTPVLAVADGHIEKLFTSVPGGLTIYQFDPGGRYAYYYAHLQGYASGLAEKQPIRRGQVIGYVGSTGNADPAAPHLHFAVFELGPEKRWWQGTAINPYPLLGGRPR